MADPVRMARSPAPHALTTRLQAPKAGLDPGFGGVQTDRSAMPPQSWAPGAAGDGSLRLVGRVVVLPRTPFLLLLLPVAPGGGLHSHG